MKNGPPRYRDGPPSLPAMSLVRPAGSTKFVENTRLIVGNLMALLPAVNLDLQQNRCPNSEQ